MRGERRRLAAAFAAGIAATLLVTALPGARAASSAGAGGALAAVQQAYDAITQQFAGKVTTAALVDGAISGMAAATGDRFTTYFTPSQLSQFTGQLQGGYVGIGAVLDLGPSGYPTVVTVYAHSPAEAAGLRAADQIVFVDGKATLGRPLQQVADEIRGPLGQAVVLGVRRAGQSQVLSIKIVRGNVNPSPSVSWHMLSDNLAYIVIKQFDADTGSLFQAALQAALAKHPAGIILDLRGDPGGYLSQAVAVAQLLVPKGPIVKIVDAGGQATTFSSEGKGPQLPPMAVLVNGGTASAAEIVSGAIQARDTGILVGQHTYGKGSVQQIIDLTNGGALKLTIAHDFTPAGRSLEQGLVPDVPVAPAQPTLTQVPAFATIDQRVITPGEIGLDVLGVQQRLAFLGDDPGAKNGSYGTATEKAAAEFAASADLPAPSPDLTLAWQKALLNAVGQRVRLLMAPPPGDPTLAAAEKYLLKLP